MASFRRANTQIEQVVCANTGLLDIGYPKPETSVPLDVEDETPLANVFWREELPRYPDLDIGVLGGTLNEIVTTRRRQIVAARRSPIRVGRDLVLWQLEETHRASKGVSSANYTQPLDDVELRSVLSHMCFDPSRRQSHAGVDVHAKHHRPLAFERKAASAQLSSAMRRGGDAVTRACRFFSIAARLIPPASMSPMRSPAL